MGVEEQESLGCKNQKCIIDKFQASRSWQPICLASFTLLKTAPKLAAFLQGEHAKSHLRSWILFSNSAYEVEISEQLSYHLKEAYKERIQTFLKNDNELISYFINGLCRKHAKPHSANSFFIVLHDLLGAFLGTHQQVNLKLSCCD